PCSFGKGANTTRAEAEEIPAPGSSENRSLGLLTLPLHDHALQRTLFSARQIAKYRANRQSLLGIFRTAQIADIGDAMKTAAGKIELQILQHIPFFQRQR